MKIHELDVSLKEAAEKLGCSEMFLRIVLRKDNFPFRTVLKVTGEKTMCTTSIAANLKDTLQQVQKNYF